jgi:ABC-type sugar transport system permease subunit
MSVSVRPSGLTTDVGGKVSQPAKGRRRPQFAPSGGDSRMHSIGYYFIFPALGLFALFIAYPLVRAVMISLTQWPGFGTSKYVGFSNFHAMISDPTFQTALKNTVVFTAATTILSTLIPMALAALLNAGLRGSAVFRVLIFLPALMSLVVAGSLWALIYEPQFGILNNFLSSVGLGSLTTAWLSNSATVVPALIAVAVWQSVGFYMLIFYAALQDIDPALYEAASLDGANVVQNFRFITVPMLRTVTSLVVTLNLINGLKIFDIIYVMTGGGPSHASESLSTYLYSLAFGGQISGAIPAVGYATAIGVMILVFGVVVVVVQLAIAARRRLF